MASITLGDLVDQEDLRKTVETMLRSLLDIPVTLTIGEGAALKANLEAPRAHTCPECSKTFATLSGLGGHRYHSHGIKTSERRKASKET